MQFTSKLTEADFNDVQKLTRSKTFWMEPLAVAAEYIAATLGLWSSARGFLHRTPSVWPTDAAIGLLVTASIVWLSYRRRQKRMEELERVNAMRPHHINLTNEGVYYDGFNGLETLVPWIKFNGWREGPQVVLLERTAGNQFVILPVSHLPEVERTLIRHLLESSIGHLDTFSNHGLGFINFSTRLTSKSLLHAMYRVFLVIWAFGMLVELPFLYFVNPKWATNHLVIEAEVVWWLCLVLSIAARVYEERVGWGEVDRNGPKSLSEALRK